MNHVTSGRPKWNLVDAIYYSLRLFFFFFFLLCDILDISPFKEIRNLKCFFFLVWTRMWSKKMEGVSNFALASIALI